MKVGRGMELDPILDRMGREGASLREAEAMREVLVERYDGRELASIPEHEWLEALGRMEQIKQTGNEGMK
jgi:Ser/Thr protein kinase RdoA (MazF antagonist)